MTKKRVFCKFHRRCYFSGEISSHAREMARVRRAKAGPFCFAVLLSENPAEQLDIMNVVFLKSERYKSAPPVIYGLARSKRGAVEVVAEISRDAARAGMPGELKRYLESLD